LETAYVVKIHNARALADPQLAFTFEHPNPDWPEHIDNSRFRSLEFTLQQGATVHGLAGYFESRLYGDVYISILPGSPNYSHGMFSWFPLYFPLREPLFAAAGDKVVVDMWRGVSTTKVWYEWTVGTDHSSSPLHNPNGRSYWIGL
jgi:protein arginine N-methyltransferase 5